VNASPRPRKAERVGGARFGLSLPLLHGDRPSFHTHTHTPASQHTASCRMSPLPHRLTAPAPGAAAGTASGPAAPPRAGSAAPQPVPPAPGPPTHALSSRRALLAATTAAAAVAALAPPRPASAGLLGGSAAAPAPSAGAAATTPTGRVFMEVGLCPGGFRADRALGDASALCNDPEPLGRIEIGESSRGKRERERERVRASKHAPLWACAPPLAHPHPLIHPQTS